MKQLIVVTLWIAFASTLTGCFNANIPKPDPLIKRDQFVKMMVDIYLVQGLQNVPQASKDLKNITQTDLYHAVLKKYAVPDTVFIRSLIYYSSFPKDYEKMHVEIIDILNEAELQFKPQDKLKIKEQ